MIDIKRDMFDYKACTPLLPLRIFKQRKEKHCERQYILVKENRGILLYLAKHRAGAITDKQTDLRLCSSLHMQNSGFLKTRLVCRRKKS